MLRRPARFAAITAVVLSLAAAAWTDVSSAPASRPAAAVNDKIGLYVTPQLKNEKRCAVTYEQAIDTLKGHARTVWVLEGWSDVEKADRKFDWSSLDARIDTAVKAGFDVGIRAQVVLCGNDPKKNFVAVSRVPAFVSSDMSSDDFRDKAARFYGELAKRYKGKARYIAIGNSVNKYFDKFPMQWDGFKKAYGPIVKAIHDADPKVLVLSDTNYGGDFYSDKKKMQPYLDFFGASDDDGFGFVFYFITSVYYGEFSNFTAKRLDEVLDEMHERCGKKKVYLIETSCFSTHPNKGTDMSGVQSNYVDWLLRAVAARDYILGVSWWQLYDAENAPDVPWDVKVGFGFFDAKGQAKPAWETWKRACTQPSPSSARISGARTQPAGH